MFRWVSKFVAFTGVRCRWRWQFDTIGDPFLNFFHKSQIFSKIQFGFILVNWYLIKDYANLINIMEMLLFSIFSRIVFENDWQECCWHSTTSHKVSTTLYIQPTVFFAFAIVILSPGVWIMPVCVDVLLYLSSDKSTFMLTERLNCEISSQK